MSFEVVVRHRQPPSALLYMARAFLPLPGFRPGDKFPTIAVMWSGAFIASADVRRFRETTGLDETSILFPHAFGFRALMATLTNRKFPLPIWNALQIRNHLVAYRRVEGGKPYDIETRVGDQRIVEKGIEIDLVTRITQASRCDWESIITFFYRGRFGAPSNTPTHLSPDLSDALVVAQFTTDWPIWALRSPPCWLGPLLRSDATEFPILEIPSLLKNSSHRALVNRLRLPK